jgi:hypothetical protein
MASKIAVRVLAIGLFAGTLDIADAVIFKSTTTIAALVNGVLALMFCIGLPISVLTARHLPARDRG